MSTSEKILMAGLGCVIVWTVWLRWQSDKAARAERDRRQRERGLELEREHEAMKNYRR
jgi:hypothetical protein